MGLGIYRASGGLCFSSADVTWNQVDFIFCPGGGSVTKNFPILSGRETLSFQVMINPPPLNRRAIAHTVLISGATVTISGGSESAYVIILVR